MTPASPGSEPWMPNGFPPPSFVVETERTSAFAGARGRWLAAAAILGALLLIAGVLLLAGQDDDKTALNTGTTTTAFADTTPTTPSSVLPPTASLPPANTLPGDTTPTVPSVTATTSGTGPNTTGATTPAPSGSLSVASALEIPKFDGNGSAGRQIALKNNGNGSLSFTSQTNFTGLTVAPATGSIGAGGEVVVTITLNGAAAAEGPFTGVVSFGGTGGTQRVTVTSTVARNPTIAENAQATVQCPTPEAPTCSRLIDTLNEEVGANPCKFDWVYKVNVSDESRLKSVQAIVVNGAPVDLKTGNPPSTSGTSGVWQSDKQNKLPPGEHSFTIKAIDTFDNAVTTTPRKVTCPTPAAP